LTGTVSVGGSAAPATGFFGHSWSVSSPLRQMMSSFFFACVWHGVVWPRRAYMSFSQYSGSVARLMSVSPKRGKSRRPKSVMSQRGAGGSAQWWRAKQARAWR
jgi:hypothetical protein